MKRTVLASGGLVAVLALLESGLLPVAFAQRASDVLQLLLAASASACALLAARRGGGPARSFWMLIGLGSLSWACAQTFWVTRGVPFSPEASYPEADLLFTASTAVFLVAFAMRPDRGRGRPLPLAIDVAVLSIAMLYLFCQIALVHLLVGDVAAYEVWSTFLFDFRGLALLPAILWALQGAQPPWRRLYEALAPAFVLLQLGGVITNQSFAGGIAGPYHAGFYDLPWTLPFVWIGLVAGHWRPESDAARGASARAPGWARTRRATVVAFVSVLLFPVVHILLTPGEEPEPLLERWRAAFALAGTLLMAVLYLIRQLFVMREAEATLRKGEERFRALLDNSADAVGVYGPDLSVHYVSGALTTLSGYRPEERIGRSPLELVHPDDAEGFRAAVGSILRRPGERLRSAFRARTRDGRWRDVEADIVNRLEEPAVRGLVANFRDVTERRRAEEERERSLSLLEATLEATADGILVIDLQGRITRFNQRLAAKWRIPDAVVASRDAERVFGFILDQLQDPRGFMERVRELLARPQAESFDTLRLGDGRVFERYSQPQRLAGDVVGRVWSFRDVSERAHAEQVMARLVAIIEATPDFVGSFDAFGQLLYVNRAGRLMLGLAPDASLTDQSVARIQTPRTATRVLEEAIPAALRDGSWSGETALQHQDGRAIPVLQVLLAHRSPGGEVDFLSTIARDISERKQAEEELRRSQTMAALGSLVAGVAHEVKEPLLGISSTLDAFESRFSGQAEHRKYIHVFREQLERLNTLMSDLIEYGKPAGLELVEGRLEEVVAQALSACSPLAERARVSLESRHGEQLPLLRMDKRRLGQVLRNLVENAVQHSPAGGHVALAAGLVRRSGAAWVECAVEDSGPGFREEDLPHLFEPFFTRRHGGTGLGLSIVHRIVTDHGGTLVARNRTAGGACVRVLLPTA